LLFADESLASRFECVVARMAVECAEALSGIRLDSGASAEVIAGGVACFAGVGSPLTQAQGLGFAGPVSKEDLDRLEAFYFDRGSPVQVIVCPLADFSLVAALGARGYRPTEFENLLYLSLDSDVNVPEPPAGTEARPTTAAEADIWADVVSEGFAGAPGVPPALRELAQVIYRLTSATPYLAVDSGVPAGGGTLFATEGAALLAGSAVLPKYRNRGIHSALLRARLDHARRLGCDIAFMGALPGSGSQRNVERLGFRVAYTRVAFVREPPE
jgi:GNAT superfamily N-acetyltransferase